VTNTAPSSIAQSFWLVEPGRGEIRPTPVARPEADEVLVRTLWTGISRGTESLVFAGRVPASQYDAMAAPFQEGRLPGPVKYGYLNVGTVEAGPDALAGRSVFCLYPHQTTYVVSASAVLPVPAGVPPRRAVLAGTVETALNVVWDAEPSIGERVTVVGAGMVGSCVARQMSQVPGSFVTLVDTNPERRAVAHAFGVAFSSPADAPGDQDLVVHASATSAGLTRSLELLRPEGTVIEASWYGDAAVTLPLGEAFHSRRLTIRSSQVGTVAPARRGSLTHRDRLALALDVLIDPAYDILLTGTSRFDELPATMAAIAAGSLGGLCHTISYEGTLGGA
jgi:2-desacetyl-2-hydroxyethyl bacteriochlorophyllide A dehydrogenase